MTIRSATPADAPALLNIYAPYVENTAVTFEYAVPSVQEFARRIEETVKKYPYLVLENEGVIQGYAYAGAFKGRAAYDWSVETSIYIRRDAHRRGFGRALYAALEDKLASMGILNAYACIAFPEQEDEYLTCDSRRFHERMGYRLCGTFRRCASKFGRWYDMIWMEKFLGEHRLHPVSPSFPR